MNTDITASVKPEYPVIDRNPPFTKTVANFSTLDYVRLSTITAVSVTVGYLSGSPLVPSIFLMFLVRLIKQQLFAVDLVRIFFCSIFFG
jgi:NADH-ubiquinone oxidoreductase complex I, 21 kDa subunit